MSRGQIRGQLQAYNVPTDLQLSREFEDLVKNRSIKFQNELEKNKALTELLQNAQQVRQLLEDYWQGRINLSDDLVKKYSYSYKGNFRPFARLFPDSLATLRAVSSTERSYSYSDILARTQSLTRYEEGTFLPIGFTKQRGIDQEPIEIPETPKIQTRTINLYRILFDNLRKENYITATHLNQSFRETDIQKFENMPQDYVVQNSPSTPYTAIGARLYESEDGYPPSAIFKSESNIDSLLNTVVASNDSVILDDIPFNKSNTGGLDQVIPASFSGGLSSDIPEVSTNTGVEVNPNVPTGVEYTGVNTQGGNTGGFYGFGSNGGENNIPSTSTSLGHSTGILGGIGTGIILIGAALLYFRRKK